MTTASTGAAPAALPEGIRPEDEHAAVLTLYGEIRGALDARTMRAKDPRAIKAVAHTILNRWRDPKWWCRKAGVGIPDDTIEAVCLKPYQFSCWLANDPNRAKMLMLPEVSREYQELRRLWREALAEDDFTGGATHYYSVAIPAPAWTRGATCTGRHGPHLFYRNVR